MKETLMHNLKLEMQETCFNTKRRVELRNTFKYFRSLAWEWFEKYRFVKNFVRICWTVKMSNCLAFEYVQVNQIGKKEGSDKIRMKTTDRESRDIAMQNRLPESFCFVWFYLYIFFTFPFTLFSFIYLFIGIYIYKMQHTRNWQNGNIL